MFFVGHVEFQTARIDTDGSGVIDYSEFMAATLDKREWVAEAGCDGYPSPDASVLMLSCVFFWDGLQAGLFKLNPQS